MKRLFCLFLVLCLLMAGCGKKEAEVEVAELPVETTAPVTEAPTTEATEPPTTEPEAPAPTNPLTGEEIEEEYTGRPVMFTINNAPAALPQYGLDDLDWMFEMETEGDVTRGVGLMADPSKADVVGPIRSCRSYFLNLSVSYDAPIFHCGGSRHVRANMYAYGKSLESWDHVDEKSYGKYFYRDKNRSSQGYAWEHTLFTTGERMAQAMADIGYTGGEPLSYGYTFSQEVALDGQDANSVVIRFRGGKDTTMVYDTENNVYKAYQKGKDWVDGSTGENVTFRNLLVVLTEQTRPSGSTSFYELDGTGDGFFAVDGKIVPVKWQHEDINGPFSFTLEDGTPITLGVGSTYCAIIDNSGSVTAE